MMKARDLEPLAMPVDGVLNGNTMGGNSKSAWEEERRRLNDLLAIVQRLEACHPIVPGPTPAPEPA